MRLQLNNVGTPGGSTNPITVASATATTCSWTSSPANIPLIASPDFAAITLTPTTATEEIVWLVGFAPGATTGIIERLPWGEDGETRQTLRAHSSKPWVHAPTGYSDYNWPSTRSFAAKNFR